MNAQKPQRPGSPAASHMLWFFILPIFGLIGFATWKLSNALLNPESISLTSRLQRLEGAVNAGERWKEAYGVAQEIHKKKTKGEWTTVSLEEKSAVYSTFERVLNSNESDSRVARYLLVTLGQLGERDSLKILEKFHTAKDPEIVFFSVWAYSQSVLASKAWDQVTAETSDRLLNLLSGEDAELKKVICAFLSQGPLQRPREREELVALMKHPMADLRWSAAMALLPRGVETANAEQVISEMLSLEGLRGANFRNFADMKQALLAARSVIESTKNAPLAEKARSLLASLEGDNPEVRNIREVLTGLQL